MAASVVGWVVVSVVGWEAVCVLVSVLALPAPASVQGAQLGRKVVVTCYRKRIKEQRHRATLTLVVKPESLAQQKRSTPVGDKAA